MQKMHNMDNDKDHWLDSCSYSVKEMVKIEYRGKYKCIEYVWQMVESLVDRTKWLVAF